MARANALAQPIVTSRFYRGMKASLSGGLASLGAATPYAMAAAGGTQSAALVGRAF